MHIFVASSIALMIDYLSNNNKGNPNKKPHSSAHFVTMLFVGVDRSGEQGDVFHILQNLKLRFLCACYIGS